MPESPRPADGAPARLACAALCLAGLTLLSTPAAAWPEEAGSAPPRTARAARARPARPAPPPALVSGYLPRNNLVPMYNEPPRFGSP